VENNRASTQRQYPLVDKAAALGWPAPQIVVVDDDLGLSGVGTVERSGFARLTAEVALGIVGIVLGLEVSRLARNNADWYRLIDLCGLTYTLRRHLSPGAVQRSLAAWPQGHYERGRTACAACPPQWRHPQQG
jgi:hypothetical protein